jgi:ABC-type dipeptide/oligopeptide/nickel transport system permease subunit
LQGGSWGEQTLSGRENVSVSAVSGNHLVVWDTATGEQIYDLTANDDNLVASVISPLATQYLAYSEDTLFVWDATNGKLILERENDQPIQSAVWRQPNGGNVIVHRENSVSVIKTTNFQYILGIDGSVRDQFSRLVYGARVSLAVGILSVTLAIVLGTVAGLIAGYVGGWTDNFIMRVMDVMLAFPSLILAIAVVTILGEDIANFFIENIPFLSFLDPGLVNALIAISIVFVPAYARIARSGVLSVKEYDFIEAYRALGATPGRILFRRVLPNVLAPLIVQATLGIGTAILDAAALSFLGLGAQPPIAEWGRMLSEERAQFQTAPHLVIFPGLAIMITVLAFNLLGDGLRDALDPRLNR